MGGEERLWIPINKTRNRVRPFGLAGSSLQLRERLGVDNAAPDHRADFEEFWK